MKIVCLSIATVLTTTIAYCSHLSEASHSWEVGFNINSISTTKYRCNEANNNNNNNNHDNWKTGHPDVFQVRGGDVELSTASDDEFASSSSTASSVDSLIQPFLHKVRNLLRSLLEFGDQKSPTITNVVRNVIERIETLLDVKILPQNDVKLMKKKKKKKATNKSKKSKTSQSTHVHDSDAPSMETHEATVGMKTTIEKDSKKEQPVANSLAKKHISSKISTSNPNYRIQRELKEFIKSPPPNLSVKVGSNIRIWIITMTGAVNTIYEGETYKLRVQFPKDYPMVPPSVYFLPPTPQHEHVYTNGDICVSLLGKDWRPTMTAQSIAVSILSILSSAQSKSIPLDNARHSQNKPGQYQKDWVYHDDKC